MGTGLVPGDRRKQQVRFGNLGWDDNSCFPGWLEPWEFDVQREAEPSECQDSVPVQIELVPGEAVTRRLGCRMMIVVPLFSEGKHSNPEAVGRCIAGEESLRSPHVCCGVHEPSGVETDDRTEKDAPKQAGPSTDCKNRQNQDGQRNPVQLADPHLEFVFAKVWNKGQKLA